MIYKCCQMKYVSPNGTKLTKHILGHIPHLYYPMGVNEGTLSREKQMAPFGILNPEVPRVLLVNIFKSSKIASNLITNLFHL